ncbi:MAG: hypothetical protein JXA92_14310 [candidate division Zixibacteria bacterium]|nr:hypothetical protein [candidate division Zixibacteria bacterium]
MKFRTNQLISSSFILILVAAMFLLTCDKESTSPTPSKSILISVNIGPGGGTVVVPEDKGIYSGITIEVPAGAVSGNVRFTLYEHTKTLPDYLRAVGPMVLIDIGQAILNLPVNLTFPYDSTGVSNTNLISIFRFDSLTQQWHPLTPLGQDGTIVSASTKQFSILTVAEVMSLPDPITFNFVPSLHGFSIRNFIPPGSDLGCCIGMCTFARWYWFNNGRSLSSLRNQYDSCLQTQIAVEAQYSIPEMLFTQPLRTVEHILRYMIYLGNPQNLTMSDGNDNLHSVLIYGIEQINTSKIIFKAYDPNKRNEDDVHVEYDYSTQKFQKYDNTYDEFCWIKMDDILSSDNAERIASLQMIPYISSGPKAEEISSARPPLTLEVTSDERELDENSVRFYFESELLDEQDYSVNFTGKSLSATYMPEFDLEYSKTYQMAISVRDTLGIDMCDTLWNFQKPAPDTSEKWDIRLPYCSTWCQETFCDKDEGEPCQCTTDSSFNELKNAQLGVFYVNMVNDTLFRYTFSDSFVIETLTAVINGDSAYITIVIDEEDSEIGWIYYEQWLMKGIVDGDMITGTYTLEALYRLFGSLCQPGYSEENECTGSGTIQITRTSVDTSQATVAESQAIRNHFKKR